MKACRAMGTPVVFALDPSFSDPAVEWYYPKGAVVHRARAAAVLDHVARWLKYADTAAYNAAWKARRFAEIRRRLKAAK